MDDEILDVVNGHDQVIGTVNRKDYKQFLEDGTGFIRAAELFIINDEGKIWVPIRTSDKTIAPNGYDYSAAGHVETGADYLQTIIRETKEEINLDISPDDVEFVAVIKSTSIRYIRGIYLLHSNTTPTFNPADFVSAEWLSPAELMSNIDAGHPAKRNLRNTVQVLEFYLTGL
jgi:isopentenyldiphosphate isomerase